MLITKTTALVVATAIKKSRLVDANVQLLLMLHIMLLVKALLVFNATSALKN